MYARSLSGLNALDYSTLTDSQLDDMYAAAVTKYDNAGKVGAGLEIVQRLATPGAFWGQLNPFSATNFPKYRSMVYQATGGMIVPPVASESVARGVAALKPFGSGVVIIAASAAVLALIFTMRKK